MSNFRKRNKISSALVHAQSLHKTLNWSFSGRIRAETATKCTKKGDARAKFFLLLFCLLDPWLFLTNLLPSRRQILKSLIINQRSQCKNYHHWLISATLYVKFTQVQYIDLSLIVQFMKAISMVTSVQLKKSTLILVRHFLSAKVSPEWRSNSGFGTQNKSPFPLNRGVPSL